MNVATHPAELRADELHRIASAIIASPLPCDRDERWRQAAILDELAHAHRSAQATAPPRSQRYASSRRSFALREWIGGSPEISRGRP